MELILHWFLSALAILITGYVVPGVVVADFFTSLVVAVVLGLVNIIIKPIILILTLPINLLTLGLFTFVINAGIILLVSSLVPGFAVNGFYSAFLFAFVLLLVGFVLHIFA